MKEGLEERKVEKVDVAAAEGEEEGEDKAPKKTRTRVGRRKPQAEDVEAPEANDSEAAAEPAEAE